MTTSWQVELEEVYRLNRSANPAEAERRMRLLLDRLTDHEFAAAAEAVRGVIEDFLPKRKRALTAALQVRLNGPCPAGAGQEAAHPSAVPSPVDLRSQQQFSRSLCQNFQSRLDELRDRYIFQWSTWYRDLVSEVFEKAVPRLLSCPEDEVLENGLVDAFSSHAQEIFPKGYDYKTRQPLMKPDDARVISQQGLTRFLDLPVAAYVSRAPSTDDAPDGRAALRTCSAVLSGIIQGYGHAQFGEMDGWSLLPRYPGSWVHCLAFLTPRHLDQIIKQLEPGELKAGLHEVVLPVIEAIDRLVEQPPGGRSVLPRLGQYSRDARRLELALELPWPVEGHRYIDIHCYLFRREVTRPRLLESASRAARLIVLELSPDLHEWAEGHDWLRQTVIDAGNDPATVAKRALEVLNMTLASLAGPRRATPR